MPDHSDLGFEPDGDHADLGFVPAEQPGILRRALTWAATPSKGMQAIIDQQKATNGGGLIGKDSGDAAASLAAATSGIPGFNARDTSPEYDERMDRYRKEHPIASILLPLAGGLAKPASLPTQGVAPAGGSLVAEKLNELANKSGRRVLYGGANGLSERFPVPDASIEAAHEAGAFKPLGTTEHAANVLSDALDEAGALKGQVVKEMEAAGIKGPDSANIAQFLRAKADWLRKNSAGTNLPELYEKVAGDIEAAGGGGRLGVQQAENIKTSLQKQAKYGRPEETLQNIERRNIASTMRQGVEDASGADAATLGTPAAVAADAALVPAKEQYALLAPAAAAAEKGLSQATKRNAFSLRDTIMAAPMAAAHGAGAGGAAAILTKAMRTYGPSTVAWAAKRGAGAAESLTPEGLARLLLVRGAAPREPSLQEILDQIRRDRSAQNE